MTPTISWDGSEAFYEVAAAIGILPNMVMARYGEGPLAPLVTVLYTPETAEGEDDPPVWVAQLSRDADGVMQVERKEDTGRRFSSFLPSDTTQTDAHDDEETAE